MVHLLRDSARARPPSQKPVPQQQQSSDECTVHYQQVMTLEPLNHAQALGWVQLDKFTFARRPFFSLSLVWFQSFLVFTKDMTFFGGFFTPGRFHTQLKCFWGEFDGTSSWPCHPRLIFAKRLPMQSTWLQVLLKKQS